MEFMLTYKTAHEHSVLAEEHQLIVDSYEKAKAIEYDLNHGDWGDLYVFNVLIYEIEEELPF